MLPSSDGPILGHMSNTDTNHTNHIQNRCTASPRVSAYGNTIVGRCEQEAGHSGCHTARDASGMLTGFHHQFSYTVGADGWEQAIHTALAELPEGTSVEDVLDTVYLLKSFPAGLTPALEARIGELS